MVYKIKVKFTIRTSCAIATLLPDGKYDEKASETCVECFGNFSDTDEEGFTIVRNCSVTHLPSISTHSRA